MHKGDYIFHAGVRMHSLFCNGTSRYVHYQFVSDVIMTAQLIDGCTNGELVARFLPLGTRQ